MRGGAARAALLLAIATAGCAAAAVGAGGSHREDGEAEAEAEADAERRAAGLVGRMTLPEKVSQLVCGRAVNIRARKHGDLFSSSQQFACSFDHD